MYHAVYYIAYFNLHLTPSGKSITCNMDHLKLKMANQMC